MSDLQSPRPDDASPAWRLATVPSRGTGAGAASGKVAVRSPGGIRADGLAKSFRTPAGTVRAVRDLDHLTGRDGRAARPERRLVGLIPFAALGIFVGHLLTVHAIGPVVGGTISLLALVSGTWFPIGSHGVPHAIAQLLPSYWLVQASRVAVGGHAWSALGWIVVVAWSVALTGLAAFVYQRDTARV